MAPLIALWALARVERLHRELLARIVAVESVVSQLRDQTLDRDTALRLADQVRRLEEWLACGGAPQLDGYLPGDREREAAMRLRQLYDACTIRHLLTNSPVRTLEELEAPLRGHGLAITVTGDPWQGSYWLSREGESAVIWSAGPDGVRGTADDLRYPQER